MTMRPDPAPSPEERSRDVSLQIQRDLEVARRGLAVDLVQLVQGTRAELCRMLPGIGPELLNLVEVAVARAAGCTCRHTWPVQDVPVYTSDVTCPIHGMPLPSAG